MKRTLLVLYVVVEMVMTDPLQLGEFHLYFLQKNGMSLKLRSLEKTERTTFVKVGAELLNNLWVTIIPLYGQRSMGFENITSLCASQIEKDNLGERP